MRGGLLGYKFDLVVRGVIFGWKFCLVLVSNVLVSMLCLSHECFDFGT